MRINLEHIGTIKTADLKIDAITVIAGDNNTGKSTIGRSLYAFFQGTKDAEEENKNEQYALLNFEFRQLKSFFEFKAGRFEKELFTKNTIDLEEALEARDQIKLKDIFQELKEKLQLESKEYEEEEKSALYEVDRFLRTLEVSVTSPAYKRHYLERFFKSEFSGSINSTYNKETEGSLTVGIGKNQRNKIVFRNNEIIQEMTNIEHFNNLGAIYLDNPFVLDELTVRIANRIPHMTTPMQHSAQLKKVLSMVWKETTVFDQFIHHDKFTAIFSEVIEGDIKLKGRQFQFEESGTGSIYPIQNMATGMKSFSILKTLIESGELSRLDILILDEPEVHLHPSWQLKYAELIVLITIEFNLKVLVTSHSPYFVEAIELYSKKHEIDKGVNYYQSLKGKKGNILKNVTNDLPQLYTDFAEPFIHLEKLRDEYDDSD